MFNRNCLFLSGESSLTMKCVFRHDSWMHSCSPSKLLFENNILRRSIFPREDLKAIVFYADMDDKLQELENLIVIKNSKVPCWPNINSLINMIDRQSVMKLCVQNNFIDHKVLFLTYEEVLKTSLEFPVVVKIGNVHRGQNKFLVSSKDDLESLKDNWNESVIVEPFFEGRSVRALIVGDNIFGIEIKNDLNWIKNQCGADICRCELSSELIQHAKNVTNCFNLDISGVDYIVDENNNFHFLEINQFPGLANIDDEVTQCVEKFLDDTLKTLENKFLNIQYL